MSPRVLDLFCGAGGASMGYHRAGFEVAGADINPQPNYPFLFHQADVTDGISNELLQSFDLVHASPPCQGYMSGSTSTGDKYPRLIAATRELLAESGVPYVIENIVPAAPHLIKPIQLCGELFGLGVIRHRLFEFGNYDGAGQPAHIKHRGRVRGWRHGQFFDGPYVAVYGKGGGKATQSEAAAAMGIDWMTLDEMREAIPPAYTQFIAEQFLAMAVAA